MSRLRSTLVLLVILIGLGAYIYFVENKRSPSSEATTAKEKLFANVDSGKIEEVKIRAANGEVTTLKKTGDTWQVVEPVVVGADPSEIAALTSNIASLEIQRVVEENASDLKPYGLAEPRVDVAFRHAGDKDYRRLYIGEKTATGGDLYAKLATDKKVFLVSGFLDGTFNRTTFDLRDKTVLKVDRDKVDAVEIQTPDHNLRVAKVESDWKITEPYEARGDFSAVEGLVGQINTALMKSIAAQEASDLKQYGLDKPKATVTLGAGSAKATLLVGDSAASGDVYARDTSRAMVFTIDAALADGVKKGPDEFRQKSLFEFRPFNATRLDVVRAGTTIVFEKVKGTGKDAKEGWRLMGPAQKDVDGTKMDSMLSTISSLSAISFADAKTKTGLDSPVATLIVKFDDGKKQEKVSFGRSGSDVFAARDGESGAARLDATAFDGVIKAVDEISK